MTKDEALDKKAENARELGFNYEPEQMHIEKNMTLACPSYLHDYTTPPQRKPLSDEEIYSLADSLEIWNEDDEEWILDPNTFARAIEAAHGIKG